MYSNIIRQEMNLKKCNNGQEWAVLWIHIDIF